MRLNLIVSFHPYLYMLSDIVIRYTNQIFPFLRASPWLLSTQFIYVQDGPRKSNLPSVLHVSL